MALALELTGIRKTFDGVVALDGAVFSAKPGEVHALVGENGAGKSSLMNIAAGFYVPDAGTVAVNGEMVALSGPADARSRGIGMVHQHFKLVKPFTVAENILLANPRPAYRSGIQDIRENIGKQAAQLGFDIDPERRVGDLSVAGQTKGGKSKGLMRGTRMFTCEQT